MKLPSFMRSDQQAPKSKQHSPDTRKRNMPLLFLNLHDAYLLCSCEQWDFFAVYDRLEGIPPLPVYRALPVWARSSSSTAGFQGILEGFPTEHSTILKIITFSFKSETEVIHVSFCFFLLLDWIQQIGYSWLIRGTIGSISRFLYY